MRGIKTILYTTLTIILLAFIAYTSGYRLSAVGLVHELDRKIGFTPSEIIYNKLSENESTPKTTIIVSKHDTWVECRAIEESLGFLWKQKGNPLEPINLLEQDPALTQYEILYAYVNRCSGLKTPVKGISSGNLNNGGRYVEADGWVYYSYFDPLVPKPNSFNPDIGTFRMKADGSAKVRFNNEIKKGLNVIGDRIYLFDPIQSMKIDGTDIKIIRGSTSDYTDCLMAIDDMLVFNSTNNASLNLGFLYTIKTDGTGIKQLTTYKSKRFDYSEGWVYYVTSDTPTLRRIRLDTTEDTLISDDIGNDFMILDGLIYYVSLKDGNKLYQMDLEGKNTKKLTDYAVSSLNTSKKKIFYIDPKDQLIYAINLDGTSKTAISGHKASTVSYVTGFIYYTGVGDSPANYRVNLSTGLEVNISRIIKVEPDPAGTPPIMGVGATNSNAHQLSIVIQNGDWIYYARRDDSADRGIYRIYPDGTGKTKLTNDAGYYLNIVGNWLYFINDDLGSRITRIPLEGGSPVMISDVISFGYIFKDGWIYFAAPEGIYPMMKMKTDGTEFSAINKSLSHGGEPQIVGNTLFFRGQCYDCDPKGIFSIMTDGSEFHVLSDRYISFMVADGEWIYYSIPKIETPASPSEYHRMKTDGSSDTLLFATGEPINLFGINDGWLYYSKSVQGKAIYYRLKSDEGRTEEIFKNQETRILRILFLKDKIVTLQGEDYQNTSYFISDMDGSNPAPFMK